MTSLDWDYTSSDLIKALQQSGICPGDTVFFHVCFDNLGQLQGCATAEQRSELLAEVLTGVVGEAGTIVLPSYTFSFCRQEEFDVQGTPTEGGLWSTSVDFLERFRRLPNAVRSRDPIHSVVAIGPRAGELLADLPNTCFGKDSVHERLMRIDAKICAIGVGLNEATFRHHVEEMVGVPFRFKKLFTGYIRDDGRARKMGWVYNVRILAENGYPDGSRVEQRAISSGKCRAVGVGRGELMTATCRDFYNIVSEEIAENPWSTARGPAGDPVAMEKARVAGRQFSVSLSPDASMQEMMNELWHLPRDLVSGAYDAALEALSTQVPMVTHEYPSGTECWSWIVPEKWTCHEAYLETMDGRRLFSYADNPLHVASYSLPFEGVVNRGELIKHLHVHPKIADAVPFIFKYYERDWGLCSSKDLRDSLNDEHYKVVIRTSFSFDTLKVGEVIVPGETSESIVLCAHLCHPHQANDDLTGVIVGMKVMQELMKRRDLRYTYRYLIVPETIGSIAYLSHNEDMIANIKGGLFLEMLGLDYAHGLQLSFQADTELDQCFRLAMNKHDYHGWTGPFRTVIGNDERQFNGPGVRIPFLSLSRVLPPASPDWPYREYHSSYDNPDLVSIKRMEQSRDLVLAMIDTLENNRVPVNNYKGEVFCSRYGLHIDWYVNPEGNKAMFDIMDRIDGTLSIAEIADSCGISFEAVKGIVDQLRERGLVDYL